MSQQILTSRDISVAGVQVISGLTAMPKRLEIRASMYDLTETMLSIGSYEANENAQSCSVVFSPATTQVITYFNNMAAVVVLKDENNWVLGTIQNVTAAQFEINWQIQSGVLSGTVNLQIIAYYH